jgi:hypothetical protein
MHMPRGGAAARLTPRQKKILAIMLNGDAKTGLLMHIIRFVMPSKSKPLKKLMYFFFEVCPKHDAQGKLRQEWILVWCVDTTALLQGDVLTMCEQRYSLRFAGTERIRTRKHTALRVGPSMPGMWTMLIL